MKRSPLAELLKKQPLASYDDAIALSATFPANTILAAYAAKAATLSGDDLLERVRSGEHGISYADAVVPARLVARDMRALARLYAAGAERIELALLAAKATKA